MEEKKRTNDPQSDQEHLHPEQSQQEQPVNEDLAKRVAEDAVKLGQGQISEKEFKSKYHEEYIKEFGVDDRPISPSDSPLVQPFSRRTLLKIGGVVAAGAIGSLFLGRQATATGTSDDRKLANLLMASEESGEGAEDTNRVQKGLVIDMEKCDGCLECVYACHHHNNNPQGVLWLYVFSYMDENSDQPNFLPRLCNHCSNPPCVKVCPVRARHKREIDGLVLTDYNLCIGCRYCMVTCPYGVNYFQWDDPPPRSHMIHSGGEMKYTDYRGRWVIGNPPKGVMGKCEFCPERQDDGRNNLVCELSCPHDALHFGDMNDPNSRPNQYLKKRKEESGGRLSTFRLLEDHGTKPNILYIGQQPSGHARLVEGPVSYADWGLVEERLPMLGDRKPWFLETFGGSQ